MHGFGAIFGLDCRWFKVQEVDSLQDAAFTWIFRICILLATAVATATECARYGDTDEAIARASHAADSTFVGFATRVTTVHDERFGASLIAQTVEFNVLRRFKGEYHPGALVTVELEPALAACGPAISRRAANILPMSGTPNRKHPYSFPGSGVLRSALPIATF